MKYEFKCPYCRAPTQWGDNPYRPFCSLRCRTLDLGHWLRDDYAIPEDKSDLTEEEQALLDKQTKPPTFH